MSAPRKAGGAPVEVERSILSPMDRKNPAWRFAITISGVVLLLTLIVISAGPIFWLLKAATSTSTETLAQPFAWWPSGFRTENLTEAWNTVQFGKYLRNTLFICLGSLITGLLVATTGGYALTVLRPRYAPVINAMVLATLFIPGVISLVSLFLTVSDLPIFGVNLLNTFWAIWLPSSASAFSVLLVARSLQAIPRDLFDAARIDGAGALRCFTAIALPLSKPIIGVISMLSLIGSYKDFLWPLLVLPNSDLQPISVALPRVERDTDLGVFMASLMISAIIPILIFLLFQRQFLRAAGSAGAIKE